MPSNLQQGISSVLSATGQAVAVAKHIQNQKEMVSKQETMEARQNEQHLASLKVKEAQLSLKQAQAEALISKAGLMEQQKAILEAKEIDRKKDLKVERFRKTLKNKKENAILGEKLKQAKTKTKQIEKGVKNNG